jgi:hypothetical protein
MEFVDSNGFKNRRMTHQQDGNPYKVDSYSKINLNQNLLDKSDLDHLASNDHKLKKSAE